MAFALAATNPCVLGARPAARRAQRAAFRRLPRAAMHSEKVDMSGEWEAVTSLSSQDDLLMYLNHQHESRNTRLDSVMATNLSLITPDASLEEAKKLLAGPPSISGLPVVDADKKLVGVISEKDLAKGGSKVKDVMSAPAVSLKVHGKVSDAALCMTEHKFHRVPVVDDDGVCVGIVTRTDIFWALTQTDQEGESLFAQHGIDV